MQNDGIVDVSSLKRVHNLDISHCQNITDISMLEGVHKLNITGCRNIDMNTIPNVENLIDNQYASEPEDDYNYPY